jgi:hypothetical protein
VVTPPPPDTHTHTVAISHRSASRLSLNDVLRPTIVLPFAGFMATGIAPEAIDEAIQANIVAVGYSGFNIPPDA